MKTPPMKTPVYLFPLTPAEKRIRWTLMWTSLLVMGACVLSAYLQDPEHFSYKPVVPKDWVPGAFLCIASVALGVLFAALGSLTNHSASRSPESYKTYRGVVRIVWFFSLLALGGGFATLGELWDIQYEFRDESASLQVKTIALGVSLAVYYGWALWVLLKKPAATP